MVSGHLANGHLANGRTANGHFENITRGRRFANANIQKWFGYLNFLFFYYHMFT